VEAFENFVRANAPLQYIHDLLKEGIPVKDMPHCFKGRWVQDTPGEDLECAIFSAIRVCQPEWGWSQIKKEAKPIKETLKKEGLAQDGDLINMGDAAGARLFEILTQKEGWFNPARGLWIYQYRVYKYGEQEVPKVQCIEPIPRSETAQQPPYAVRLNYDVHYDAIEPDKNLEI